MSEIYVKIYAELKKVCCIEVWNFFTMHFLLFPGFFACKNQFKFVTI